MRRFLLVLTTASLALTGLAGSLLGAAGQSQKKATLSVRGIDNAQEEAKAEEALRGVPGVTQARVSFSARTAVVTYDPLRVKVNELLAALRKVGFTASEAQAKYICPTCQATYQAAGACLICEATLKPIKSEEGGQSEKGGPKP